MHTKAEAYAASRCGESRDSCPSAGMDPVNNYMDYTPDACMDEFTTGQIERMRDMITV
jgi:hypothetical protein